jgi:hypothetical protein
MQHNDLNTMNDQVMCMSFIRHNTSSEILWWLVTQEYFDTTDTYIHVILSLSFGINNSSGPMEWTHTTRMNSNLVSYRDL